MKISLIYMIVLSLMIGCCPKSVETDRFFLSDTVINTIPYESGNQVGFVHSTGFEFDLLVVKDITEFRRTESDHCGDNYIAYQIREVILQSDIPGLNIVMTVYPAEINYPSFEIQINRTYFHLLTRDNPDFEILEIEQQTYNDVFVMEDLFADKNIITPERIYYNKNSGIIQIQMTNNETYTLRN
jgi:hypothetical protein